MEFFQSIILGLVQGLTEFLPVSSSGNLLAVKYIFGWTDANSLIGSHAFDAALHFGTLIAVVAFFWKDWIQIINDGLTKGIKTINGKLFWMLVVATIPGAIAGFLLEDTVENVLSSPLICASMLLIMGIVLYSVDKKSKHTVEIKELTFKQTFLIGLSQMFAIIPGVSRSGITMTTSRLLGLTRQASAKFSFLLSAPIVFGASGYKMLKLVKVGFDGSLIPFIVGILVSAIVGLLTIRLLLQYLKKGSFKVFMWYRIVLAVVIFILFFIR